MELPRLSKEQFKQKLSRKNVMRTARIAASGLTAVVALTGGSGKVASQGGQNLEPRFNAPFLAIQTDSEVQSFIPANLNKDEIEEVVLVQNPIVAGRPPRVSIYSRTSWADPYQPVFSGETKNEKLINVIEGDWNSDGRPDIILTSIPGGNPNPEKGYLEIFLNQGGFRFSHEMRELDGLPHDLARIDFYGNRDMILVTLRANEGTDYPEGIPAQVGRTAGKMISFEGGMLNGEFPLTHYGKGDRGDFPALSVFNNRRDPTVFYRNVPGEARPEPNSQHIFDRYLSSDSGVISPLVMVSTQGDHEGIIHDMVDGYFDIDCSPDSVLSITGLDGKRGLIDHERTSRTNWSIGLIDHLDLSPGTVFDTVDFVDVTDDGLPDVAGGNPGISLNYCIQEENDWRRLGRCGSEAMPYGPSTNGTLPWNAFIDYDGDDRKDYFVIDKSNGLRVALRKPIIEEMPPAPEMCIEVTPRPTSTSAPRLTPEPTMTSTAPKAIFYNYLPATWVRVRP